MGAKVIERTRANLADPGNPNILRLDAEINKLVYALYKLNVDEIRIVEIIGK